jgi:hypothetical protein
VIFQYLRHQRRPSNGDEVEFRSFHISSVKLCMRNLIIRLVLEDDEIRRVLRHRVDIRRNGGGSILLAIVHNTG